MSIDDTRFVDELGGGLVAIGIQYQGDSRPSYVAIYSVEQYMEDYEKRIVNPVHVLSSGMTPEERAALLKDGLDSYWDIMSQHSGPGAPITVVEVDDDGQAEAGPTKPTEG